MHPGFKITVIANAGREDITSAINKRLLRLTVCDQTGLINDRLTVHLDDRKPYVELPFQGEKLEVELGYMRAQNNAFPAPMKTMGTFIIDELECEKERSGRTCAITAHAWDSESPFKQQRTLHYHEVVLKDILQAIADRNLFDLKVTKELGEVKVPHKDQIATSDASFLDDLSLANGAEYKILDNTLFFAKTGEIAALASEIIDTVQIDDSEILRYRYLTQGRGRYTAVRAKYHDTDKEGKMVYVETEKDDSASRKEVYYEIPETFSSKEDALAAAQSQKERFDKGQATFNFSCVGTPELMADGEVMLTNFRPEIPEIWSIEKVTHVLSQAGYICEVECGKNLPYKRRRGKDRVPRVRHIN